MMNEIGKIFFYLLSVAALAACFYGGVWFEYGQYIELSELASMFKSNMDIPNSVFFAFILGLISMVGTAALNPFKNKLSTYGDAHFAKKSEVRKMGKFDNQGIILGEAFGQYIRSNEPLSTLLLAPPGTGKTAGFVIPNLFSCGNSMLIFDVKGELFRITSKCREGFSKVLKFSPASPDSAQWNPLAKESLPSDWVEQMVVIDRIASLLYPVGEKHDHWITEGKNMFLFYAMFLVWRDGGTSIPEIRSFSLSTSDAQIAIEEMLDDNQDMPDRIREEGNGLLQKPANEFGSVFSTYKSKLNVFADPYVAKCLSGNDFVFSDFRKNRTSLYLVVKAQDVERLAPVVTLLFEMCAMYILSNEPKETDHTVTLMIDEFARLGKMQQVLDMPALSRGNRGHAMLIAQDYAQINRLYGDKGGEILDGTCAHFIIYPQNNAGTAKNFSEKIGFKTVTRKSKSSNSKDALNSSTSLSEEKLPLVSQQDLLSMPEWKSLIIVQNHFKTPIKANPIQWWKDPVMKKLAGCVDEDFRADDDVEAKLKSDILPETKEPAAVVYEAEREEQPQPIAEDKPEKIVSELNEVDPYAEKQEVTAPESAKNNEETEEIAESTDDDIDSILDSISDDLDILDNEAEATEEIEDKNSTANLFG